VRGNKWDITGSICWTARAAFVGFEEIEAADDVEAVRAAEDLPGGLARELWCGKRKVKTFVPTDGR